MRYCYVILLALAVSSPAYACIPAPMYVDIDKAESSIVVEADKQVILRGLTSEIIWKHTADVSIEPNLSYGFGGMHTYSVIAKKLPITADIQAVMPKKTVSIKLILTEPAEKMRGITDSITKGGCGSGGGNVTYK